jgi:hypothetical protein
MIQSHVSWFPPPIAFLKSKRASGKHETTDHHEFEIRFDPSDENFQKTEKATLTYEDGDADMWCGWREQLDELYRLVPLTTAEQQAFLQGKAFAPSNRFGCSHWWSYRYHRYRNMCIDIYGYKYIYVYVHIIYIAN